MAVVQNNTINLLLSALDRSFLFFLLLVVFGCFVFDPNIFSVWSKYQTQSWGMQEKENSRRAAAREQWCMILFILPSCSWLGAFKVWSTDLGPASNQRQSKRETHGGIKGCSLWGAQPEVDSTRPAREQNDENQRPQHTLAGRCWLVEMHVCIRCQHVKLQTHISSACLSSHAHATQKEGS